MILLILIICQHDSVLGLQREFFTASIRDFQTIYSFQTAVWLISFKVHLQYQKPSFLSNLKKTPLCKRIEIMFVLRATCFYFQPFSAASASFSSIRPTCISWIPLWICTRVCWMKSPCKIKLKALTECQAHRYVQYEPTRSKSVIILVTRCELTWFESC